MLAAFRIPLTKAVVLDGGLILVKWIVEMLTVQIKTENFSGGKVVRVKISRNLFIDSVSVYFCINLLLGM
jgi:hypothetical protein